MAGHSKFKNIQHRKGRQDAVRSKMFSKLAREITVAAKMGAPDPAMNPRLRLAVQNAKSQSPLYRTRPVCDSCGDFRCPTDSVVAGY